MAGKSSMKPNSLDGSLEVGKRTWREGVKLQFKRLEKKKKKKYEYKRDLLSQSKWIQNVIAEWIQMLSQELF